MFEKPKIIDCFIFYNELKMLYYRLDTLYNYVDYFILVEARYTFANNPKELYFEKNKHMMAPIENFRLMLIFRISLFFVAFLGFCPSLFHLWDSDAQMYSAIAGFVMVIVWYCEQCLSSTCNFLTVGTLLDIVYV